MKKYAPYVVFLAIIGLALLVWFRPQPEVQTVSDVEQVTVAGVGIPSGKEPVSGIDTLLNLAQKGDSLECQIVLERTEAEGNVEGTYFADGGSLRGDFLVPAPEFGGSVLSSMIVSSGTLYVWSVVDGETFGFKTSLDSASTTLSSKEPVPLNQLVRYTCTPWTEVDGSVFIPPLAVTFTDAETAIEAGMEYGTLPN